MLKGISFGFVLVLTWLLLLTGYLLYDKMISVNEVRQTILVPPQLEIIGEWEHE